MRRRLSELVTKIAIHAPAKINLFLHIVGKRADEYHLLESLIVFANYGDLLEIEKADNLSLEIVGEYTNALANTPQESNLVWKAAIALQKYTHDKQGAHIRLTKNLPIGSGIGGGSADAAAAIHALSALWDLNIPEKELSEIALGLGSDVPVCLLGKPALMRGIGDEVINIKLKETAYIVLLNPNIPLATAEIFQSFSKEQPLLQLPRKKIDEKCFSLNELNNEMKYANDLERVAIKKLPIIGEMIMSLRNTNGCFLARMSGSGATCFGLYPDKKMADDATKELQKIYPQAWCVSTDIIQGND